MKQLQLFLEVLAERNRQDARWGGAEHDDTHSPADWCRFITEQMEEVPESFQEQRFLFVKIAALAFAALESGDRLGFHFSLRRLGPVDTRPSRSDFSEGA